MTVGCRVWWRWLGLGAALCVVHGCSDSDGGEADAAGGEGGDSTRAGAEQGSTEAGASSGGEGKGGATPGGSGEGGASTSPDGAGEGGASSAGTPGAAGEAAGGALSELGWPKTMRPSWDGSVPSEGVCSVHAVCWNNPYHTANELYAVWASSATSTWVGGNAGTLAHYDGSEWTGITAIETETRGPFFAFRLLRGTQGSTSNVWAVGWETIAPLDQVLYRFDGSKWTKMTAPSYPVKAIWATGANEVWATSGSQFVSHWNGNAWSYVNVGKMVTGIWGFSATDIWVSGETVLQFNGSIWQDRGGGGSAIWGASSGDMWTGNGAHLVASNWAPPPTSQGTGFKAVIGANATNLFFLGGGNFPINYYLQNAIFQYSEFSADAKFDAWPVTPTDYFVVGESDLGELKNLIHGDPAGLPVVFDDHGPLLGSDPASPYQVVGKVLQEDQGGNWVPLRTFDAGFSGEKYLAWTDALLWVCSGGVLYEYDGFSWTTPENSPSCSMLQVDGEGRLWVATLGVMYSEVAVYDGESWTQLPKPPLDVYEVEDFAVGDHEAWVLAQTTAYRWNSEAWDTYELGTDITRAPNTITVRDGVVHMGRSSELRFDP